MLYLLQVIFITLKVVDVIDWSWWTVFIPLYIVFGYTILLAIWLGGRD